MLDWLYPKQKEASLVPYTDRNLACVDCGTSFVFTADDQEFHAQKGYTNDPKRCPACRATRRQNSDRGGFSSGGGGGGYGQREMTSVTCSRCGNTAEVPFVPRNDRPVYCNDCFARERASSGGGAGGGRRY